MTGAMRPKFNRGDSVNLMHDNGYPTAAIVTAYYSDIRPDDNTQCRHHPNTPAYLIEILATGSIGLACEPQLSPRYT